jgi:hypothetical protein
MWGGILGPQASLLGPGVGTCCSTIQVGLQMYDFSPVLPADSPGSHAGLYRTASDSKMAAKVSRAAHNSYCSTSFKKRLLKSRCVNAYETGRI